jgi:IS5 family transposase
MKITTRCGEDAVAGLNEAPLAKAEAAKLLRTDKVPADTTVIPAAVSYPTDSGLLAQAIGSMARSSGADQSRRWCDPHRVAGSAALGGAAGPLDRREAEITRRAAARSGPGRGAPDHR